MTDIKLGASVIVDGERKGVVSAIGAHSVSVQFPNPNDPLYPYERTVDVGRVTVDLTPV